MRGSARAGGLLVLGACAAACVAACLVERAQSAPLVSVTAELPAPPSTTTCPPHHVEIVEGRAPDGSVEITRATSAAGEAHLALRAHEEAAARLAQRYCADGVSVLRATETPRGVQSAVMVFWRRAPAQVDAGVVDERRDGGT